MKHRFLICVVITSLVIIISTVALASEETLLWTATGEYAVEADPEYQPQIERLINPWLDSEEYSGIAYFIYEFPSRIKRYDMNAEVWLPDIWLNNIPTAFTVDDDGFYVSFGLSTSSFNLDGTGETHLYTASSIVRELFTVNQFLYIYSQPELVSINKHLGTVIDSRSYHYSVKGFDTANTVGKAFARTTGVSPSDIVEVILNSDGTLGNQTDSPYHGDFPAASMTIVFPGEEYVADNSGIVYSTTDLTYVNSLAGYFEDMEFYGDLPVLIRNGDLIAYSNTFLETGRYTPTDAPLKVFIKGEHIFSFSGGEQGTQVDKIAVNLLQPVQPGPPVDPNGLSYVPDAILMGSDETIYILSKDHRSVFRWSSAQRRYTTTLPLIGTPLYMAYSGETNRLYFAYESGQITQIQVGNSSIEEPIVNSPQRPCGLSTAGEYLFVCDPSGAWVAHFTYSLDGEMLSWADWNYFSEEYVWNETNRKMYHFRDSTSPNDLLWEDIDENGVIGDQMDSPYHSGNGIQHPILVAPNGTIVLLGSGRIYNAITLDHIFTLPNEINDGVWWGNNIFTIRTIEHAGQLQKWNQSIVLENTRELYGEPHRMFRAGEGTLAISVFLGRPWFSIWDFDLNLVYQLPVHHGYLPAIGRS